MTRFQARLCFLSFVCLFVCIATNALVFQDDHLFNIRDVNLPAHTAAIPTPKPKSVDVRSIAPQLKRRETKVVLRKSTSDKSVNTHKRIKRRNPIAPPSRELVRAIQRELKSKKYDPGGADGVVGVVTRAAIMAYEYDKGLSLTGEPSYALLKRLLLGPSYRERKSVGLRGRSEVAVETIRAVQDVLAKLGYAPGVVDGMNGSATRNAIKSFEKDYGLPQTGRVSGRLVKEIKRVTGADLTV